MSTTQPPSSVRELRETIDALPEGTRQAMIVGLSSSTVITGGFIDRGGVCPAMAAVTSEATVRRLFGKVPVEPVWCATFPEAWDRFCGVHGRQITRPATSDEVRVLRVQLCESLAASALAEVTADAKRALRERRARSAHELGLDWLLQETLVLPEDFATLEPPRADPYERRAAGRTT